MVLVYHVTLQTDAIKDSFKIMEPIKVNYHPSMFGGHNYSGNGDIMVFVCHLTLQDHMIKALYNFMV